VRIKRAKSNLDTMVFTIGTLFEAGLLLVNAIAILNEERFLQKGMVGTQGWKMVVYGKLVWPVQGGVTPIDSIVTAVTALVNPYTKEGVESLRILPYTSVNVRVVNGQQLKFNAFNGQSPLPVCRYFFLINAQAGGHSHTCRINS